LSCDAMLVKMIWSVSMHYAEDNDITIVAGSSSSRQQ
jgi:hypothetical protein